MRYFVKEYRNKQLDYTKFPVGAYVEGTVLPQYHEGYGFLRYVQDGNECDVFYHYRDITNFDTTFLQTGDRVSFLLVQTEKGLRAKNIKKI